MAMSVGSGSSEEPGVMAAINTTPLVDVMLVLLIIFLITIPVINKTVKVDLPKAVNIPTQTKPENITVAVDKSGNIYWNDKMVPNRDDLLVHVKVAALQKPQPEVHIRADRESRYESVGRVLYALQRGGIVKVGFLTEPDHGVRGSR
jgi:biopolymer transport protein ExbD